MDILNDFGSSMPPEAQQALSERGLVQRRVDSVVSTFDMQGYDKGIAYRFFIASVPHGVQTEEFDMEINQEVEMIQWFVSKTHKPAERVRFLPKELLKFSKDGKDIKGGLYKEDYDRFKEGLGATGLALDRWDKATLAQVATLRSESIHTVEQFAALPTDRVEGRFPKDLVTLFNQAVHYTRAQEGVVDVTPFAEKVTELKEQLTKRDREIEQLSSDVEKLLKSNSEKGQALRRRKERLVKKEEGNINE